MEDYTKIIAPQLNEIEHRQLYDALRNPVLLRYLNAVLIGNAIELLRSPLPVTVEDLRYATAHAQSRGVCQLADALLNIVKEGDTTYAAGK
jgi:hypothetical protein